MMADRFERKYMKTLGVVATCLMLAACNTAGKNKTDNVLSANDSSVPQPAAIEDRTKDLRAFCPKTVIRDGTEVYRTFANGVKKDDPDALKSLEFQSTILTVVRECIYTPTSLGMKVGIKGRVINGPTGATGTLNVPIRIAITNPVSKDVVYSQLHQVPVTLNPGRNTADFSFVDSQINLAVPDRDSIVVYVGFDEGPPPS